MLVLFETAAGYGVFKLLDESKLSQPDNIWKEFESPERASQLLKLQSFRRFKDTADALQATTSLLDGKVAKSLKKLLKKLVVPSVQEPLAVADAKLGNIIKEKFNVSCVSNSAITELMRGIRTQLDHLIAELPTKEAAAMALGLAHSLCRYKLKFSADKVDTMIIQAVSLLDDLDKELNNYIMRCREWYGWHFPELGKIVQDHMAFAKVVNTLGLRENIDATDLSGILPDEIDTQVKDAAKLSMGTEISELDIMNIRNLCSQIIEMTEYRNQLYDYLKNRMMALAPNLTVLLGELVAARLVSHAGSLTNLAKYPASTVQILGAEKALFRALKTKKDTPKYGIIYHAQLIGQAPAKIKGKMSRMLAAKSSLACRVDALGDGSIVELGVEHRALMEQRLQQLSTQGSKRISGTGQRMQFERHSFRGEQEEYQSAGDSTLPSRKHKLEPEDTPSKIPQKKVKFEVTDDNGEQQVDAPAEVKEKKKKKKQKEVEAEEDEAGVNGSDHEATPLPKRKKKKHEAQE